MKVLKPLVNKGFVVVWVVAPDFWSGYPQGFSQDTQRFSDGHHGEALGRTTKFCQIAIFCRRSEFVPVRLPDPPLTPPPSSCPSGGLRHTW